MTRIAVVQPALALGEVEQNLARVEDLIRDAHREHGAEVIVVPEGFTTPNVYAKVLRGAARPVDGQPLQMLTRLARELDCVLAGGFLAVRGADTPTGRSCSPSPTAPCTCTTRTSPPPGSSTSTSAATTRGSCSAARSAAPSA